MTTRDEDERRRPRATTLYLPLAERGASWLACATLFGIYAASMARDLSFYDSGELALAAIELGLGHPPGQPLHTLLGFLFAHVPLWSKLVGVTLVSVVPGALSLVAATSLAQTLLGPAPRVLVASVPFLLAALGLHASVWEPATRVEVYALASFLALWAVAKLAAGIDRASVFCAGLALGLCASANPMIALCVALALAPAVLGRVARRELPLSALALALAGGSIGLLPYAYVPIAAQQSDVFVWGAPRDTESLTRYLSGQDFARSRGVSVAGWLANIAAWLGSTLERGLMPWLLLGLVAHARLAPARGRGLMWIAPIALGLLAALIASNTLFSLDVPDYDGYLAPGVWLAGAGAGALWARLAAQQPRPWLQLVLALTLALTALWPSPHLFARTRHVDRVARALADRVLASAPAGAIAIVQADAFAGPLYYLQEVEHVRRDVVVIVYGLASSSWQWAHLAQRHPSLAAFELHGAGGRAGRVRRFLAAQRERPVLIESAELARTLELRACPFDLLLRAGAACERPLPANAQVPELLQRALSSVGSGSPATDDALASIGYGLGVSLWQLGAPREAYRVLLSSISHGYWPSWSIDAPEQLDRVPPLASPLPAWRRSAALGDPARNLFVAALMLETAGLPDRAEALRRKAAELGLPEAQ